MANTRTQSGHGDDRGLVPKDGGDPYALSQSPSRSKLRPASDAAAPTAAVPAGGDGYPAAPAVDAAPARRRLSDHGRGRGRRVGRGGRSGGRGRAPREDGGRPQGSSDGECEDESGALCRQLGAPCLRDIERIETRTHGSSDGENEDESGALCRQLGAAHLRDSDACTVEEHLDEVEALPVRMKSTDPCEKETLPVRLKTTDSMNCSKGGLVRHPHPLEPCVKAKLQMFSFRRSTVFWTCDGCGLSNRDAPYLERYRCTEGCDYDLCDDCFSGLVRKTSTE